MIARKRNRQPYAGQLCFLFSRIPAHHSLFSLRQGTFIRGKICEYFFAIVVRVFSRYLMYIIHSKSVRRILNGEFQDGILLQMENISLDSVNISLESFNTCITEKNEKQNHTFTTVNSNSDRKLLSFTNERLTTKAWFYRSRHAISLKEG